MSRPSPSHWMMPIFKRSLEAERRNVAASVFYSEHPLILTYFKITNAQEVSCREFCDWVAGLPQRQFNAIMIEAEARQ